MSNPKITPKNLTYNTTLPPFLARLQASNSSAALDGRHERPLARPRRARDPNADAEDEPAYVDETTNEILDREEVGKLLGTGDEKDSQERGSTREDARGGNGDGDGLEEGGEGTDRFGRRIRRDDPTSQSQSQPGNAQSIDKADKAREEGKQEKLAAIGASRKRKVVKVIGADDEAAAAAAEEDENGGGIQGKNSRKGGGLDGLQAKGGGKGKAKGKKVKLSFGDDDGEG
jgi:Domain of unknown function (DUF4604)